MRTKVRARRAGSRRTRSGGGVPVTAGRSRPRGLRLCRLLWGKPLAFQVSLPHSSLSAPAGRLSLPAGAEGVQGGSVPERPRSCENIDFGFFRPRVFSYLQAEKSGFFNIFTASKPFRTAGGRAALKRYPPGLGSLFCYFAEAWTAFCEPIQALILVSNTSRGSGPSASTAS